MITCSEYYLHIVDIYGRIVKETIDFDKSGLHAKNHSFIRDFSDWISILNTRSEIGLLETAAREYQQGLIAVIQGQYRQAYNCLRFFLEHSLAAVHFSANELQLRLWVRGEQDIYWNTIIDNDNGIFSKKFVRAFCDPLVEDAPGYGNLARGVYRECSEFTHGNYLTQSRLPTTIEFREDIFTDWHDKAKTAQLVVYFAMCSRYLMYLDQEGKRKLESSILEHLGHISIIQGLLGVR